MKQSNSRPLKVSEMTLTLYAVTKGYYDGRAGEKSPGIRSGIPVAYEVPTTQTCWLPLKRQAICLAITRRFLSKALDCRSKSGYNFN
jgi:hypothetical protein